jgi:hypothetical protein
MALGVNYETADGGDIMPIIKYDSRSGRVQRIDRVDGDSNSKIVEITKTFKALFDFENVETGFIEFATGGAPSFSVTRLADGKPAVRPTPAHKAGVRIMVKLHKDCGGDVRELASVAKAFLRGIDELHNAYLEGVKLPANAGKLPVVVIKDTIPVTSEGGGQKSTNYSPVFDIVGWAPRPADLVYVPKHAASAPAHGARGAPHTGSTQVGAPPPAAPPAAAAQANDFG